MFLADIWLQSCSAWSQAEADVVDIMVNSFTLGVWPLRDYFSPFSDGTKHQWCRHQTGASPLAPIKWGVTWVPFDVFHFSAAGHWQEAALSPNMSPILHLFSLLPENIMSSQFEKDHAPAYAAVATPCTAFHLNPLKIFTGIPSVSCFSFCFLPSLQRSVFGWWDFRWIPSHLDMGRIYKCVPFMSGSVFGLSVSLLALSNYSCPILDPQEGSFPSLTDTKVPWSDEETMNLLDIWGKDSVQRALKGCLKNRHIFTQISQNMAERGFMRTVEQCQTRIKRLKKYFRQNNKWVLTKHLCIASFTTIQPVLHSDSSLWNSNDKSKWN